MPTHYLALTIDTDPDGLNTYQPDRTVLNWAGLDFAIENFHQVLPEYPLTWYVRADGQLDYAYGSLRYLLDTYADFWQEAVARGDELGWHPHLYTVPKDASPPEIIADTIQALGELERIWNVIKDMRFDFPTFRMGEGWHTAETLSLIEALGFTVDSTAIPERDDSASGHPRNWRDTPNRPYYPDKDIPRLEGQARNLLEIPMNSWSFQASYDKAPKLRYMNPCIHPELWQQALKNWQAKLVPQETYFWTMILHPSEAMPHDDADLLYAYSLDAVRENLATLTNTIEAMGHKAIYTTVSDMAKIWRQAK